MRLSKFLRNTGCIALAAIPFAACTQDEHLPQDDNRVPLQFAAQVSKPQTRATYDDNIFPDGAEVSVVISNSASDGTYTFHADGNPAATFSATPTLYWEDFGSSIDAYAYCPAGTYSFPTDQSTAESLAQADFLFAPKVTGITNGNFNAAKRFTFLHKTVKVTATLTAGDGIANVDGASASFYGYTAGVPDAAGETLAGSGSGEISPLKSGNAYTALLIPKNYAGENFIKVTVNDKDYYYTPASLNLQAGYSCSLAITVTESGLDVTVTAGVEPWNTGGSHSATGLQQTKIFTKGRASIDTALIPAGTFRMGSPADEPNRKADETQHTVTLTQDFYMGKYEVTNAQYAAFLNDAGVGSSGRKADIENNERLAYASSGSYNFGLNWRAGAWGPASGCANYPVFGVTWYGAKAFAEWIGGSLPTEAQWEYACRGGQAESLPFGIGNGKIIDGYMANIDGKYAYDYDNGGEQAVSGAPYLAHTTAVGSYSPNGYGLYDMHGNVEEFCLDWYAADYGTADATDPIGDRFTSLRVVRGGYYDGNPNVCRSASRDYSLMGATNGTGFRVVFFP